MEQNGRKLKEAGLLNLMSISAIERPPRPDVPKPDHSKIEKRPADVAFNNCNVTIINNNHFYGQEQDMPKYKVSHLSPSKASWKAEAIAGSSQKATSKQS
jgi:hypothetical protein